MSIFSFMASGVQTQTDDRTGYPRSYNSTAGGIVLESEQGPYDPDLPTLIVSNENYARRYGPVNPAISPAQDCVNPFLKESDILYVYRQINGALWAGSTLYVDRYSKVGKTTERVFDQPFPIGMQTGYKGGARDFDLLAFADDMITGNSFTFQITDGATSQTVTVPFTTNHASTVAAIVSAINTALATFGTGGVAVAIPELDGTGTYLVALYAPLNATVSYSSPVISGGASQTTARIDGDARLFDVYADNPGKWAGSGINQIGYRLINVDAGVAQRQRFIFSGAILTGQTFKTSIGGTQISVPFATDSDTTMENIAVALRARPEIASATVEKVAGASNNDRIITIIAKNAGPSTVQFISTSVSGTGSLPAVTIQETLKGQNATGEMTLQVYQRSNVRAPVESFRVSMAPQTNASGRQTHIENVVNLASGSSIKIKIVQPRSSRTYQPKPVVVDGVQVLGHANIRWLGGGDDGAACTNGQIADGWNKFLKRTKVQCSLLINGGYTSPIVQQRMVEVAETRLDAIAILDIPSDKTATQAALAHRLETMNIDSSFGALYSPWLQIADPQTDERRAIPPSGHVAGVHAYSERMTTIFHAPAGLERGLVKGILGLTEDYEDGDRELLEPNGINPIVDWPGYGPAVFGEETMQYRKSILSSVHARKLTSKIQVLYADVARTRNFDPANENLWFKLRQDGKKLLQPYKDSGGIVEYEIVCDITNNGPEVRDQDGVQVWVYYTITPAAKRILIKHVLLPTSVKVSEEIARDRAA